MSFSDKALREAVQKTHAQGAKLYVTCNTLPREDELKLLPEYLEFLHAFCFTASNNGPMIPVRSQNTIFNPGVTGKGSGHGMGLYIVQQTMKKYGGEISLTSTPEETAFSGTIPKEIAHLEESRNDQE